MPNLGGSAGRRRSWSRTEEGSAARPATLSRRRCTSASAITRWVATMSERVPFHHPVASPFSIKRSGRHQAADAPGWAHTMLAAFRAESVRNLVFLPDTVMGRLLALAEAQEDDFFRLINVHREEEAVGILAGLFLGGQRGAMLVQSSGLGNSLNALGSLAVAYHIPFPMLVSLRGELGEFNPAQLQMGRAVPGCLDALNIRHVTLQTDAHLETIVSGAL